MSPLGQVLKPRGGGGEGPWYSSNACGFVDIDVLDGQQFVVWGRNGGGGGPDVTGPAVISTIVNSDPGIFLVEATGDGTIEISDDSCAFGELLVHRLPDPIIQTACA